MEGTVWLVVASCILIASVYSVFRRSSSRRGARLPPGPPGWPFVGNIRDIPTPQNYPWFKCQALCRKYNTDILRINALGVNIVILDSLEVAKELLDRRSALYSDRPRMVMLNELAGFGWNFGTMDYGEDWRACRKMAHHEFHATSFAKYRPLLLRNAHDLLRRLAHEHGARLPCHLKQMVGANIMEVTYGIKVLPEHDPFIELAEAAQECFDKSGTGGGYLVDILPILKYVPSWFPGAAFRREADAWHKKADLHLEVPYADFMQREAAGRAENCMAKALLEEYGDDEATVQHAKATTATMYMGGSETVAASMHTFFLAMLLHPEIQDRAHSELEKVIGTHQLPTFDDYGSIPYIDALVKETLRWHPIVALDLPHKIHADDIYNGYLLEKDSLVMVNIWAILHDERTYPDPHTFQPERFLTPSPADGTPTLRTDVPAPEDVAFGFGRRVCPGQVMAYETMWIAIASFLACLEIGKAKDAAGAEIAVSGEMKSGFVTEPKPFPCEVRPRSDAHASLLCGV